MGGNKIRIEADEISVNKPLSISPKGRSKSLLWRGWGNVVNLRNILLVDKLLRCCHADDRKHLSYLRGDSSLRYP